MQISNSFYENVINYKPVLFHWLDGFLLSQGIGMNSILVRNFICSLPKNIIGNNKIIISTPNECPVDYYAEKMKLTYGIELVDLQDNKKIFLTIKRDDTEKFSLHTLKVTDKNISYYNTGSLYDFDSNSIDQLLEIFRYNIIHTGDKLHAISLLTFVKDNSLYICVINSGEGLEYNTPFSDPHTHKNLHSPHQAFIICDDINDRTKLVLGIKKICTMAFFYWVYNDLKSIAHNIRIKDSARKGFVVLSNANDNVYVINKETLDILKIIVENCSGATDIYFGPFTLEKLVEMPTNSHGEIEFEQIYNFPNTFYLMCCTLLKDNHIVLTINEDLTDKINLINKERLKPVSTISTSVINKMIFHAINNQLCIYEQENGSCAWYSMYWPLLMYHIYYEPDFDKYYTFISNINTLFNKYVQDIFAEKQLIQEFNKESFTPWKIVYNFFCDIGLLNKEVFETYTDSIFKLDFNCDIVSKDWDNLNNKINDFDSYTQLKNVDNSIINQIIDLLNHQNKSEVMIIAINKLSLTNSTNITNTLFYLFYSIYTSLNEKPSENFYSSFTKSEVKKKISNILYTLKQIVKHGDIKLNQVLQNIQNEWISILYNLINNLDDIINNDFHLYEYYHVATFFLNSTHKYSNSNIIRLAKFFSASVIVSKINFVVCKIVEEIYNHTSSVTNIISYCNDIICLSIYGKSIYMIGEKIEYIPVEYRNINKFLRDNKISSLNYINIYFSYLSKNSIYSIDSKKEVKILKNRPYDDFIKERDYYYENPEYIYNNYSDIEEISNDSFIRVNILDIMNKGKIRKKLISYYAKKFVSFYVLSNTQLYLEYVLTNLHLLIFGLELDTNGINEDLKKKSYSFSDPHNILFKYFVSSKKYNDFYDQLYNILKQTGDINFPLYLADNFNKLTKNEIDEFVEKNKKIFSNTTILNTYGNYSLMIDGAKYNLIDNINTKFTFLNFFSITNNYQTAVYRLDNNDIKIIIHNDKFVFTIIGKIIGNNFKAIEIFVNGNKVIKKQDINFPFKYTIPTTCDHLIYKVGTTFNILYFVKQYTMNIEGSKLIPPNKMETQIIEISINENTMLYPKTSNFEIFEQLCKNYHIRPLNIIFSGNDYDFSYKVTDKIDKQYNYNKKTFLTDKFSHVVTNNIKLLNKITDPILGSITLSRENSNNDIKKLASLLNQSEYSDAFDKLIGKIEHCRIVDQNKSDTIEYFKCLQVQTLVEITKYTEYYKNAQFNYIINKNHFDYLLLLKVLNTVNMLMLLIDDSDLFCSQLKILKELYKTRKNQPNYNFEVVFETLIGYELLDEQQSRFYDIVSNYTYIKNKPTLKSYSNKTTNIVNFYQTGGHIYPLHHFMMSKGKSAIMSPMLMLYFSLIADKNPYIIVPEHLVNDTKSDINQYGLVFGVNNKVTVISASEIKNKFLEGYFINQSENIKKVFIIDEFDSLLDPIKSNYNIVDKKELETTNLYKFIYQIVNLIKDKGISRISINDIDSLRPFTMFKLTEPIVINILKEINQIYQSIKTDSFVENINWGIDSKKYLAVPYLNKDKPIENSNFTSCIITIFLTLYYFIILKNLNVSDLIIKFITEKNLFVKIFNMKQPLLNIKEKILDITSKDKEVKSKLFKIFFDEIFSTLTLAKEQKNTSFVDILNIDLIYKVGYSGTINLDLPEFIRSDNIFKMETLVDDKDESVNVLYALVNGKTIIINQIESNGQNIIQQYVDQLISKFININDYDAFIDQVGIFKNILNKEVADFFYNYFGGLRDIIYISETDSRFVVSNNINLEYTVSKKYLKPFIYYSQGHVVGVDIKQDYLPRMKGLVTINNKSVYTNVAQAVFRLRKLNLGHSVDILFVTNDTDIQLTSTDVCNLIKCNDEKLKINKRDLLIYQTLKSEIRKRDIQLMLQWYKDKNISLSLKSYGIHFNKVYTEKIKYYFTEPFPQESKLYLKEIVTINELLSSFNKLFNKINNIDKLKKLVFNMDSDNINITVSRETEKEVVNVKAIGSTVEKIHIFEQPIIKFDYTKYIFDYISEPDIFNRITIPINKYISCVPNICTHFDGYKFNRNNSGLIFVFIPNMLKLLLIPGYMAPIFSHNYILLNTRNLTLLNNKTDDFFANTGFIDCLRHTDLIKFINDGTTYELLNTSLYTDIKSVKELFVLYIILSNYQNKLAEHESILYKLEGNTILNTTIQNYIYNWTQGKYVREIIIPITEDTSIIDPYIKSIEEYRCDSIITKYKEREKKILETSIANCLETKKKFFSKIQSENAKLNKNKTDACEANKNSYKEQNKCEENKQIYLQQDQIQACAKYKIDYFDAVKIKTQSDIMEIEKELDDNNNKLVKYTNKLNALYKTDNITQFESEIICLQNQINMLQQIKTPLNAMGHLSTKQKSENKIQIKLIQKDIDNKEKLIKSIEEKIIKEKNIIKVKESTNIKKYNEKILMYNQKILDKMAKINKLKI